MQSKPNLDLVFDLLFVAFVVASTKLRLFFFHLPDFLLLAFTVVAAVVAVAVAAREQHQVFPMGGQFAIAAEMKCKAKLKNSTAYNNALVINKMKSSNIDNSNSNSNDNNKSNIPAM